MSQRLMTIVAVASTAACIAMAILVWQTMREGKKAQLDFLVAQSEANEKMVDQLAAVASRVSGGATTTPSWLPLRIKLVSEDGKPVTGSVSFLTQAAGAPGWHQRIETDSRGIADFESVPVGVYKLQATVNPLHESTEFEHLVGPGRSSDIQLVCPVAPPAPRKLRFELAPPNGVEASRAYFLCLVYARARQFAGRTWSTDNREAIAVLVGPNLQPLGELIRPQYSRAIEDGVAFSEIIQPNLKLAPLSSPQLGYAEYASVFPYEAAPDETPADATTPKLKAHPDREYHVTSSKKPDGSLVISGLASRRAG
jgi:hypothetical protein